jgi:hypothetical protein
MIGSCRTLAVHAKQNVATRRSTGTLAQDHTCDSTALGRAHLIAGASRTPCARDTKGPRETEVRCNLRTGRVLECPLSGETPANDRSAAKATRDDVRRHHVGRCGHERSQIRSMEALDATLAGCAGVARGPSAMRRPRVTVDIGVNVAVCLQGCRHKHAVLMR